METTLLIKIIYIIGSVVGLVIGGYLLGDSRKKDIEELGIAGIVFTFTVLGLLSWLSLFWFLIEIKYTNKYSKYNKPS